MLWFAVIFELLALGLGVIWGFQTWFAAHLLATVLGAAITLWVMKREGTFSLLALSSMSLFLLLLPVIGALTLAMFSYRQYWFQEDETEVILDDEPVLKHFDFPSLQSTDIEQPFQRLNALTTNDYLGLLMSSRDLKGKQSIFLLKDALTSKVENTRLLAYALYAKKENQLSEELESLLAQLKASNYKSARLHLALAQFYQYLLDIDFFDVDLALDTQKKLAAHAATVIKLEPKEWQAYVLLAKVKQKMGQLVGAEVLLRKALKHGAPPALIKTQLQSISFDISRQTPKALSVA